MSEENLDTKSQTQSRNMDGANALPPQEQRAEINNFFAKIPMPRLQNHDIEAWFYSLEFWFPATGISADTKKFNTVLASIEPSLLTQLTGIINAAPEQRRYEYIKDQLIKYFSESNQRRINRLLSELPLGDLRPSQLFHEMRRVAGDTMSNEAVKSLWAQRLPEHARAAVVASSGTIEEITRIADAIMDALPARTISVTGLRPTEITANNLSTNSINELDQIKSEINKLTRNIEKLMSQNVNNRNRNRSQTRGSGTRGRSLTPGYCWYHTKFGKNSRKCRSPCHYHKLIGPNDKDQTL